MANKERFVIECLYNGNVIPYVYDSLEEVCEGIENYKSDEDLCDVGDDQFVVYKVGPKFKVKRTVTLTEIKPPKKKKKAKAKAKLRKVTVNDDERV